VGAIMSFKEKYTTERLILDDKTEDKIESTKTVLTNDTFATCELLDELIREINFRGRK
jgi:hypothetical protein